MMSQRLNRNCLLGNLEESLLSDRIRGTRQMDGFQAEIVASDGCSIFCPNHRLPVTTCFYTIPADLTRPSTCYIARIQLDKQGYRVPPKGTVQVTLLNPCGSVVKIFLVQYNLTEMPVNSCTFIRQRILFCPIDSSPSDTNSSKYLQYLIHLRFKSTKSGRIFLSNEIKAIIFQRSDLEAAATTSTTPFEVRSLLITPSDPCFSTRISRKRIKSLKRSRDCHQNSSEEKRRSKSRPSISPPPSSPSLSLSSSSSSFSFNFLSTPGIGGEGTGGEVIRGGGIGILGPLSPPLSSSPSPTNLIQGSPFNPDQIMDQTETSFPSSSSSCQPFPPCHSLFLPITSTPMIS